MSDTHTPTFAQLAADPEIAALLDFTPVPRQFTKVNGWTPAMQRMFIAWLAWYGSPTRACDEIGKARSGVDKLYKALDAHGFRAAWDAATALAERRRIAELTSRQAGAGALNAPTLPRGRGVSESALERDVHGNLQQPGQRLNHLGEWESEASIERRGEEAAESIRNKLLRARRIYLCSIASDAGKRAAFEILTELPIDWDLARKMEPQPDEPYRTTNQREPDMILTADSGWSFGEIGYGPNKLAEARKVINEVRAQRGQEPLTWDAT